MDLSLTLGDIEIISTGIDSNGNTTYDLNLMDDNDSLTNLVERTLETPLGYITIYSQDIVNNQLNTIDALYGDSIYKYLSEPLNSETLTGIQDAIQNCVSILSNVSGLTITDINLYSYTFDNVEISVTYSINDNNTTIIIIPFSL